MARKGYEGEYKAKKELQKTYGVKNVIKIAIAQQGCDFFVIKNGKIILQIEIKETISKKYYPLPQEKEQIKRIIQFGENHKIRSELWIYYRKGAGIKTKKEVKVLYEPFQK